MKLVQISTLHGFSLLVATLVTCNPPPPQKKTTFFLLYRIYTWWGLNGLAKIYWQHCVQKSVIYLDKICNINDLIITSNTILGAAGKYYQCNIFFYKSRINTILYFNFYNCRFYRSYWWIQVRDNCVRKLSLSFLLRLIKVIIKLMDWIIKNPLLLKFEPNFLQSL